MKSYISHLLWLLWAGGGSAFTVGPPPLPALCKTMNPQHHDYKPQGTEPPYTVSVDRRSTSTGNTVLVTLSNAVDPTQPLIGFYVQARDENDNPIGTFSPNKDTKVHSCFGVRNNAATHGNGAVKKDNVTIVWSAPRNYQGEVVFTATAMRDFVTFWVFLQSDPVEVKNNDLSFQQQQSSVSLPSIRTTPRPPPDLGQSVRNFVESFSNIFVLRPPNGTRTAGNSSRRCNDERVFNQWFCNLFRNPGSGGIV